MTLVDSLLDDSDVVEFLTDPTEQCVRLSDVGAAGLLLTGPRQELHLMAATSKRSRDLEMFQLRADEGPCPDCFTTGQLISAPELRTEGGRWPQFVSAATDAGFVAVHAVPMRAAGTVLGALGLFGTRVGSWTTPVCWWPALWPMWRAWPSCRNIPRPRSRSCRVDQVELSV